MHRTWLPAKQWHYPLRKVNGTVTLPIYRDKLITERFNRYLQVGPVEMPAHRKCGVELDFHGHRYLVERKSGHWPEWPPIPASQREQYLVEQLFAATGDRKNAQLAARAHLALMVGTQILYQDLSIEELRQQGEFTHHLGLRRLDEEAS